MAQRIAPRPAPCHRATLVPNQISCCSLTRLRSRRLPDLGAARAEGALLARRRRGGEPCRVCHALLAEEAAGRRGGGGAGEEQARAVRPRRRSVQRPRQRARRLVLRLQLGADARRRGGEGAGRRRLAQGGGSVGARRVVRPATRGRPGARGVTARGAGRGRQGGGSPLSALSTSARCSLSAGLREQVPRWRAAWRRQISPR
mmetsp:Transcript_33378/g.110387  ORF Transcript_33378/g.110387 Transcript_33378/m.110387 type:complete len:202 (-) Transcript_33378:4247-4852(-)